VLIIEVHDAHVQVLLCGDEYCSATETDAVLAPSVTGLEERLPGPSAGTAPQSQ
jgi:hypothetical protein